MIDCLKFVVVIVSELWLRGGLALRVYQHGTVVAFLTV